MSIPASDIDGDPRSWFDDFHAVRDLPIRDQCVKHLLLVLMTFVRQDSCWPSMQTIANALGVSKTDTAREWIKRARQMGLLSVQKRVREDGTQTSNRYIIDFDRIDQITRESETAELATDTLPRGGGVPPRAAGGGPSRVEGGHELSSRTTFSLGAKSDDDDLSTSPMPEQNAIAEPFGWWKQAHAAVDKWSNRSRKHPLVASRNETQIIRDRLAVSLAEQTVLFGGEHVPALMLVDRAVEVLMANGKPFKSPKWAAGCIIGTLNEWRQHGAPGADTKPARKSAIDERRAARAAKEFPEQFTLPII